MKLIIGKARQGCSVWRYGVTLGVTSHTFGDVGVTVRGQWPFVIPVWDRPITPAERRLYATHSMEMCGDGTLDECFRCTACDRVFRYTYSGQDCSYDEFLDWALADAIASHEKELQDAS